MAPEKPLDWKEDVFPEEIEKIRARRNRGETSDAVRSDLVGIASSGGGIRSATFGLGVLESLKEARLLDSIDYMSTVSGGGYIGAWLSANCRRADDRSQNWLAWTA